MKSEDEIKKDWQQIDNEDDLRTVAELLEKNASASHLYLANIIASICSISVDEMMDTDCNQQECHARWLFWYAYRYMTDDTFEHISKITLRQWGVRYCPSCISNAVIKMTQMTDRDKMWGRRWLTVKRIIKLRDGGDSITLDTSKKITITIPIELKNRVEIKYN